MGKRLTPWRAGSEAFFGVDAFRVRHSGSRQLPINNEAAPPLPPATFCLAMFWLYPSLAVPIAKKASLPGEASTVPFYISTNGRWPETLMKRRSLFEEGSMRRAATGLVGLPLLPQKLVIQ